MGESDQKWLIYGAYGYTGKLVAEEAVRRGHKPMLAGRSPDRLLPLAERLGLDPIVIGLEDEDALINALTDFNLVFHAAGPFIHTSAAMVQACLKAGAHYLDIAGEVMVFENLLALDQLAQERKITIIPGVGFNVLATDCLARYTTALIDEPTRLEIATHWISGGLSPGSFKTMIENFPLGAMVRRQGELMRVSVRKGRKRIQFMDGDRDVVPVSLGDLSTAYATTGIPNIATYTALPSRLASAYTFFEPVYRRLFGIRTLRRAAESLNSPGRQGTNGGMGDMQNSQAWVRAGNATGEAAQAWLETPDSYHFTAAAGVRCVERVLAEDPQGAMTPAQAFGVDFVLEIPGTRRADKLPGQTYSRTA